MSSKRKNVAKPLPDPAVAATRQLGVAWQQLTVARGQTSRSAAGRASWVQSPDLRTIRLADLANEFANNSYGHPRKWLDEAAVRDPARAGLTDIYGLTWTTGILLRISWSVPNAI